MDMRPGYKQTDVGVIPEEWVVKRLGDLATIRDGTHQTPSYVPDGVPFYSVEHVTSGDFTRTKFISPEEHQFLTRSYKIERGDILMTRIGSIGDCRLVDWDVDASFYVSLALLKVRGADAAFVSQYSECKAFKAEVELHSLPSATPKKINLGPISDIRIPIPPLSEQRAIATALSDVDALLDGLDRLIAKKRDLKRAATQQLLTGRMRLPGFHGAWEVKRIGSFADCTAGGTPLTNVSKYWGGSIRWMSSGELNLKRVTEVAGRITNAGLEDSSAKLLPARCVLIGLAGQGKTRGTVAINLVELSTNQSIAAVLPNDSFVPEYLYFCLDARYEELRELSSGGSGRGGLNLKLIKTLAVPFPTAEEQRAIATVLSDMDAELAALEARRNKTHALKQAMMQELLTGRTRLV
jgi:type I restriction enzyme, S subunit